MANLNVLYKHFEVPKDSIRTQVCNFCKETLPETKFGFDSGGGLSSSGGYRKSRCKECAHKQRKIVEAMRKHHPYPDTDYSCPICSITEPEITAKSNRKHKRKVWELDHCHTTGKFRGYICNKCNMGLSHFSDDVSILKQACCYLDGDPEGDVEPAKFLENTITYED